VKVTLANPSVAINGQKLTFPVTIQSGQYIEFESLNDCRLYDERGEVLQRIPPQGDVPTMLAGDNAIEFSCLPPEGHNARANITLITQGKPLRGVAPKEKIDWKWLKTEYDEPRIIQSLDGKQNVWEIRCRKDAKLEVEIAVDRVGGVGAGYESKDAFTIESFDDLSRFADSAENRFAQYVWDSENKGIAAKPGVTFKLERSADTTKVGKFSLRYSATSKRSDSVGWCAQGARFSAPFNLSGFSALGFWLRGDGNGESFKVQLRDVKGAWQDMVTPVDFTGWRYVEFELGAGAGLDLSKIEYIIVYFNNLPGGRTVTCHVDDLRALRESGSLRNPVLTVAGKSVTFPASLAVGDRLVTRGGNQFRIISRDGTVTATNKSSEALPSLRPGVNRASFSLGKGHPEEFRVRVAVRLTH